MVVAFLFGLVGSCFAENPLSNTDRTKISLIPTDTITINASKTPNTKDFESDCIIEITNDTFLETKNDTTIILTLSKVADAYSWYKYDPKSDIKTLLGSGGTQMVVINGGSDEYFIIEATIKDEEELLTNGDFEAGNTGFTSEYTYISVAGDDALSEENNYAIGINPKNYNTDWVDCTNGTNVFIANGSNVDNQKVYSTTATINPNTYYSLSFKATNIADIEDSEKLSKFMLSVNDEMLGGDMSVEATQCDWKSFDRIYYSDDNTTANIDILSKTTASNGNDFAIDDISLRRVCFASDTIHISTIQPNYITIYDTICGNETYDKYDFIADTTGEYVKRLINQYGCDSIITLYLTVNPTYNDTLYLVGCGEGYNDDNFLIEQSGIYTRALQTIEGCDSIVTIVFKYVEPFVDSISAEIYKGDTFTMYGFNESTTGSYEMVYQDTNGCDSTYYLDLKVINFRFPNVVTPNGDGVNDIFDITDVLEQTIFTNVAIRIYNRYGRTIFEVENPKTIDNMWNPDATNTPTGTYFFRFTAKSQSKNIDFVGTIDVLR